MEIKYYPSSTKKSPLGIRKGQRYLVEGYEFDDMGYVNTFTVMSRNAELVTIEADDCIIIEEKLEIEE